VAEQAGMTAKEFSNYLEVLALSQTVDNRLCGHAEGASSIASGHYSHAEGAQTMAYGYRNCDGNALIEQMEIDNINVEEWSWLDRDDFDE
jgi:hypothetical protein